MNIFSFFFFIVIKIRGFVQNIQIEKLYLLNVLYVKILLSYKELCKVCANFILRSQEAETK